MAGNTVVVSVLGDTSNFSKAMKGLGVGVAAVGAVALAGLAAVGTLAVAAVKAAAESEKVAAQTDAVIKSTGGAAGKSAEQIGELASQLSKMSGIDDELIQSGANVLLTFTNISGVNFDAATKSALDMSVALGQDLQSASILVGKALNDPIKGISALSRVGVQLTDQQKEQIKTMVAAGDTAGAQAVILGELQRQFGGSAEAFGNTFLGSIEKVKNGFGNVLETLGSGLLPGLTAVLGKVAEFLEGIAASPAFAAVTTAIGNFLVSLTSGGSQVSGFISQFAPLLSLFSPLGLVIQAITPLLPQLAAQFQAVGAQIGGSLNGVLPTLTGLLQSVVQMLSGALAKILPVIIQLVSSLAQVFGGVLAAVIPVVVQIIDTLISVLTPILDAILPPLVEIFTMLGEVIGTYVVPIITQLAEFIGRIVEAIAPLLVAVGELVGVLLEALMPIFQAIIPPIMQIVSALLDFLMPIIEQVVNVISTFAEILATVLGGAIDVIVKLLSGDFEGALQSAKATFEGVWTAIVDFFNQSKENIGAILGAIGSFFSDVWNSIVNSAQQAAANIVRFISGAVDWFREMPGKILGFLQGAGRWLIGIGEDIINGLLAGLENAIGAVWGWIEDTAGGIADAFAGVLGIFSPSRVFKSFGKNIVQGLEIGLRAPNHLDSIMTGLSNQVSGGFDAELATPTSYETNRSASRVYEINVQAGVGDPVEIGRTVKKYLQTYERAGGFA